MLNDTNFFFVLTNVCIFYAVYQLSFRSKFCSLMLPLLLSKLIQREEIDRYKTENQEYQVHQDGGLAVFGLAFGMPERQILYNRKREILLFILLLNTFCIP